MNLICLLNVVILNDTPCLCAFMRISEETYMLGRKINHHPKGAFTIIQFSVNLNLN